MTPGQIAQLQELARCYMPPRKDRAFVWIWLNHFWTDRDGDKMSGFDKAWLRRLMHQYRHQIAAMRRNRKAAL